MVVTLAAVWLATQVEEGELTAPTPSTERLDASGREDDAGKDERHADERFVYTRHAKCRMDCRRVDAAEVQWVWSQGKVNNRKSDPHAKPCPVVVKEARTNDGQLVRAVVGRCRNELRVITVIDLEDEHTCSCE